MPVAVVRALVVLSLLHGSAVGLLAQDNAWALKMFSEQQKIDFGRVARGSDARYPLKITNIYKETVHISSVRTTCGCSAATPSKSTLASRETAIVEVTMDTRKFQRQKNSNVIVTFDAPLFAEVRIPISAYIRTDVVLTPGAANFGAVEHGQSAQQSLEIAYAGRNDWQIREVKTNSEHLTAEVTETARGNGRVNYTLQVSLRPDAPVGVLNQQILLVTDDADPYVPVLVTARVEADIMLTAPDSLGTLRPGEEKTFNVVLRGRRPFAVEKIECESDMEAFKVRLTKEARPIHVLPFTVTPPEKPGEFNEEFTVTIAGRPEPLTFSVYGRIAESVAN